MASFTVGATSWPRPTRPPAPGGRPGEDMRVLLVDHQDSFVHTLAAYFAEQGARVRYNHLETGSIRRAPGGGLVVART